MNANQPANSIVLNATNTPSTVVEPSSTYINPVRASYGTEVLQYTSAGEVTRQGNRFDSGGNLNMAGNVITGNNGVQLATLGSLTPLSIGDTTLAVPGGTSNITMHGNSTFVTNTYLPVYVGATPYWIPLLQQNPLL